MERYDYREAVKSNLKEYITEWMDCNGLQITAETLEDARESIYDDAFTSDQVTGNGSGSYTFDAFQAEEYICHNLDLLGEAVDEFGGGGDVLRGGAEACDVTIRCYILGQVFDEVLKEILDEQAEA